MKSIKDTKTTSFLAETIELSGNLYTKGGIRIDGSITGRIESASTIYIGDSARVTAEIVAQNVVTSGSVLGNVSAEKTVKINAPGIVEGEIRTCNLGIEQGVYFNGRCEILSPKHNPRPKTISLRVPKKPIPHRE